MATRKFTPGPWQLESQSRDGNGSDLLVTTADGAWNIADCRDQLNGLADRAANPEANARLISAAPDLYAALEAAEALLKLHGYPAFKNSDSIRAQARAALRKADGDAA